RQCGDSSTPEAQRSAQAACKAVGRWGGSRARGSREAVGCRKPRLQAAGGGTAQPPQQRVQHAQHFGRRWLDFAAQPLSAAWVPLPPPSPPELRRSAAQPRSGLRQQAPAGPVGPRGRQAPSEPGFPREPPRPPRRWQLLGDGARRLEHGLQPSARSAR
ncbi:unnamed protein product, partial [Prorocentrum cordatum]